MYNKGEVVCNLGEVQMISVGEFIELIGKIEIIFVFPFDLTVHTPFRKVTPQQAECVPHSTRLWAPVPINYNMVSSTQIFLSPQ